MAVDQGGFALGVGALEGTRDLGVRATSRHRLPGDLALGRPMARPEWVAPQAQASDASAPPFRTGLIPE